jgi:hypothetical protein
MIGGLTPTKKQEAYIRFIDVNNKLSKRKGP